jgi:hypothetical protein
VQTTPLLSLLRALLVLVVLQVLCVLRSLLPPLLSRVLGVAGRPGCPRVSLCLRRTHMSRRRQGGTPCRAT